MRHALVAIALLSLVPGCSDSSASSGGPSPTGTPTDVQRQMSFIGEGGVQSPVARLAVPDGFTLEQPWYVVSSEGDEFLGLWQVGDVTYDACHPAAHEPLTPGPSPQELADALGEQKGTDASEARPVSLAGYDGVYVEITGPRHLRDCGRFPSLWVDPERGLYGDSQVDRLWILDVGGQRLVVDASHSRTSTPDDVAKLTEMVESLSLLG